MRYLVAVIGCERDPYLAIENSGVRQTWAKDVPDGVTVLYYYGKPGQPSIIGDRVYLDCVETLEGTPTKAMLFFKEILKDGDLECVYFTNLSSYVRLDRILPMFQSAPKTRFYSGVVGWFGSHCYASGSGFFISRDLIQMLVDNQKDLRKSLPGDVGYGEYLVRHGITIAPQGRCDIERMSQLDNIRREQLDWCFHFRCKQAGNRQDDIAVMHKLHAIFHPKGE